MNKDNLEKKLQELEKYSNKYITIEKENKNLKDQLFISKETLENNLKQLEDYSDKLIEKENTIFKEQLLMSKENPEDKVKEKKNSNKYSIIKKENKNLKEQLIIAKDNFENLESSTLQIQEKYFQQCQNYDNLSIQYRELLEKSKSQRNLKSKSTPKSLIRSQATSPIIDRVSKQTNTQSKIFHIETTKEFTVILPLINYKDILESKENTIRFLEENLEKINSERISLAGENKKLLIELENYRKINLEKINSERISLAGENKKLLIELENYRKIDLELINKYEEIQNLEGKIVDLVDKNNCLLKDVGRLNEQTKEFNTVKIKSEKEIENLKQKLSIQEKNIEIFSIEKENLYNLQKNYQKKINEIQQNSKQVVDKDSAALQKELKYAKALVIRNQNEITKLNKEKECLNQELFEVKIKLENRAKEDDIECIKTELLQTLKITELLKNTIDVLNKEKLEYIKEKESNLSMKNCSFAIITESIFFKQVLKEKEKLEYAIEVLNKEKIAYIQERELCLNLSVKAPLFSLVTENIFAKQSLNLKEMLENTIGALNKEKIAYIQERELYLKLSAKIPSFALVTENIFFKQSSNIKESLKNEMMNKEKKEYNQKEEIYSKLRIDTQSFNIVTES